MILLANGRRLSCCLLKGGNQLGETRRRRASVDPLCKPGTDSDQIQGRRGEQGLQPQFVESNGACLPDITDTHPLGNRSFDPSSLGIQLPKLWCLLTLTGCLQRLVGLLVGTKREDACLAVGTVWTQRTGLAGCPSKLDMDDGFARLIR